METQQGAESYIFAALLLITYTLASAADGELPLKDTKASQDYAALRAD